jgi:hypothetical protein
MTQRVDLDGEPNVQTFANAQRDEAIEQRLPQPVTGKIVVGNEKPLDPLRIILAHDVFEIVR